MRLRTHSARSLRTVFSTVRKLKTAGSRQGDASKSKAMHPRLSESFNDEVMPEGNQVPEAVTDEDSNDDPVDRSKGQPFGEHRARWSDACIDW